jgi:hypothetical protein
MAYDKVDIIDSTPYPANGRVEYASIFCKHDDFHVDPGLTWEADSRGVCLVTEITAEVLTPEGPKPAKPYESAGTTYSKFAIIVGSDGGYEITRRTEGSEDQPPEDYEEPSSEQK